MRDLEVCLDPVDLSEGGGGTPFGPLEGVCGDPRSDLEEGEPPCVR